MSVFVEFVFLDNFIIDWMLVWLSRKALKLSVKKRWVSLSSLIGSVGAIVYPFLKVGVLVGLILKIPLGLAIVFASGKFRSVREFLRCFCLFLSFTFLSGGAVTAIFWGLGLSFDPVSYANGELVPLFIILAVVVMTCLGVSRLIKALYKKRATAKFAVKCKVVINGNEFDAEGYFDSGNNLVYKRTNSPIVLFSNSFGKKLKTLGALDTAFFDMVAVNTVAGKSYIPIYKTQSFLIYNDGEPNILYNVMLGAASVDLFCGNEYDLLLGVKLGEVI